MKLRLITDCPVVGELERNLKRVEEAAQSTEADLLVFGELFLSGYTAREAFKRIAVSNSGPAVGRLRDAAKANNVSIAVGTPRRDDTTQSVYDSALFIHKSGKVEAYDKCFLANFGRFDEGKFFQAGNKLALVESDGVRFGLQICYDMFFPELSKALALSGADAILNLSASPSTSQPLFEPLFAARAIENGCFVAYCNLAGPQGDFTFWGGSQVVGPTGDRKALAPYGVPSTIDCVIDPNEVRDARSRRPTIRDTRVEMLDVLGNTKRRT